MKASTCVFFKPVCSVVLFWVASFLPSMVVAQVNVTIDTASMTYNQISSALKLYVFPSKNQSNDQQKKDEYECYKWSIQQSGIDPLNLPEIKAAPVQTGPDGKVVGSAAKGAIVGAAIGSISGDAGDGAAVGAIAGGAGGIRQKRATQARQEEQAKMDVQQQKQAMADSFKKAFSACIEGKGYTIK
jgi:hypothetical protein